MSDTSADNILGALGALSALISPSKPKPHERSDYAHFKTLTTRWMDNDAYGHINNVVYYSFFDTVVNAALIEAGALDIEKSAVIGLVVETHCNYFAPLTFPQTVHAGLRVAHIGASSVRYEIGLFAEHENSCAAQGHFVHVYVDRLTRRPVALPENLESYLEKLKL
jgi:acyl-CoA thioester hydrolase